MPYSEWISAPKKSLFQPTVEFVSRDFRSTAFHTACFHDSGIVPLLGGKGFCHRKEGECYAKQQGGNAFCLILGDA